MKKTYLKPMIDMSKYTVDIIMTSLIGYGCFDNIEDSKELGGWN